MKHTTNEVIFDKIKAKRNLYNQGLCFRKGYVYRLPVPVSNMAGTMKLVVTNDQGKPHIVGPWWREFEPSY